MNDSKTDYYRPDLLKKIDKLILSDVKYLIEKDIEKLNLNKDVACLLEETYDGGKCKECVNYKKYCEKTEYVYTLPKLWNSRKDKIKT